MDEPNFPHQFMKKLTRGTGMLTILAHNGENGLVNTAQSLAGPLGRLGLHVCGGGACLRKIRSGNSCMNRP